MKSGPSPIRLSVAVLAITSAVWGSAASSSAGGTEPQSTSAALPAPSSLQHLVDSGHLLPADAAWLRTTEAKLAAFQREHGIKILLHYHSKSPNEEEDKVPGAYMRSLSTTLGTIQHGVLLVYFADDPDWRMWLSDDLTAKFAGQAGTAQELTANKAIHNAKEALFDAAKAKANAAFAAEQTSAPAGQPPAPSRLIALHTDALLDGLFAKLGTK